MSLTQHISCFKWSKQFPPSHSLPLKSSRVPETKDWLLMREGSEVLLELTNYFRALSGHHCFSTKQISLSIWCCKCGVWSVDPGLLKMATSLYHACFLSDWRYSYLERVVLECWWITLAWRQKTLQWNCGYQFSPWELLYHLTPHTSYISAKSI